MHKKGSTRIGKIKLALTKVLHSLRFAHALKMIKDFFILRLTNVMSK